MSLKKYLYFLYNTQRSDQAVVEIQQKISEVEKKIIEGKKRNQYLEKCKYVLDYKIKELRKEAGPLDKTIEELKKHTKGLERVSIF